MSKTLLFRAGQVVLPALFFSIACAQKTPEQIAETKRMILANPRISSVEISNQRQTPSLITLNQSAGTYSKTQASGVLAQVLNLRSGVDYLMPLKEISSFNNIEIMDFTQYFKGVKVDHASFKALVKNGSIVFFNGSWFDVPSNLSIQPTLTEAQALSYAKIRVGAQKYAWENIGDIMQRTTNVQLKAALQKEYNEYLPKGELVIIEDHSKEGVAEVRLAYKFNIYAVQPLSRSFIYVDAKDGRILLVDKIIKHIGDPGKNAGTPLPLPSVNATVFTRYGGHQAIKTKQISGTDPNNGLPLVSSHPTTGSDIGYIPGSATYVLMDDTRGKGIETYDLNGVGGTPVSLAPAYTQAKAFTDVDNNWDSVEHTRGGLYNGANEAENDDIAWDAHWGAEVVYDYWLAKHNRKSYDGADAKIKSYIHYGPAYDNAFWNGSVMTYGDGSGVNGVGFKALTSLDVCGHEIGHGVCSFTSDLVYEKESGAMNEGLSDIWAACIEHFSMVRAGSTVPANKYRPFYIGEQISFDPNSPLRRMDNPKAQSNPDTYKGTNWQDVDCTPNLANDECGVHTNSGVINHWFFLLTAGSKFGTRPAEINSTAYYFADSDDELKDDTLPGGTVVPNSVAYRVNGVGFDISEQITFLMETMLTSTATYAEARAVSIEVAKVYGGDPCSSIVKSVTDAWFAVGVGAAFPGTCTPTFGLINTTAQNVSEASTGSNCNRTKTVTLPVLIPASTTVTVTPSGTATLGKDYTLSTTTLQNSSGSTQTQNIVVTINDDAVVDRADGQPETIILNLSGTGLTNTSITINIHDDDVLPRLGADSIVLMNETFTGAPNNFTEPSGWTELMQIAQTYDVTQQGTGHNQWGLFDNQLAIAYKPTAAATTGTARTYDINSASQTIAYRTTPVDARGLSNLQIKFDYTVGGESDPAGTAPEEFPKLDYVELVYSDDGGTTWKNFGASPRYRLNGFPAPASGTFNDSLPAFLNNSQFLLGFQWNNDALAGNAISVSIDNLTVKAAPTKIESEQGDQSQENMVQSEDAYYYSTKDKGLIARLRQNDAFNYGCVTATITKAGTGTFNLYSDGVNSNRVVNKFISINPTTNNASGAYTITLYLTEAEIVALEQNSGLSRSQFYIYKTVNDYTQANNGNTLRLPATYTAITVNAVTIGGEFTATFSTGFSGFAVGVPASPVLPVNCLDFKATKGVDNVALNWKVGNDAAGTIYEAERSSDGVNFQRLGNATANGSGQYSFTDRSISGLKGAYYRIKAIDANGSYHYLCTILFVNFDSRNVFAIGNIYPNPGKGDAAVNITSGSIYKLRIEYLNMAGQVVTRQNEQVVAGAGRIELKVNALAAGSYLIRFKDEEGRIINTQQFIKQ